MYTSHGHYIPGTNRDPKEDPMPDRCGGVKSCTQCMREVEVIEKALSELSDPNTQPEKE